MELGVFEYSADVERRSISEIDRIGIIQPGCEFFVLSITPSQRHDAFDFRAQRTEPFGHRDNCRFWTFEGPAYWENFDLGPTTRAHKFLSQRRIAKIGASQQQQCSGGIRHTEKPPTDPWQAQ